MLPRYNTDGPPELTSVSMAAAVEHYNCMSWLIVVKAGKLIRPGRGKPVAKSEISWHTFRHTLSTLLKANSEDVKVVQELLRHASAKITLDTYSQALTPAERATQSKVVSMIRPKSTCTVDVQRVLDPNRRKCLKRFGVPTG